MKGIILSAGQGSRLLPLTETMPKCLVAVDGRAILDHQLDALAAAGVAHAVVVGGYRWRQIAAHLAAAAPPLAVTLAFNPFWAVASSIGSVWAAREHLTGDFCLMNGDTLFDTAVIAAALAQAATGVSLLVEPVAAPALDDMRVAVEQRRVAAVDKTLARAGHRSLGVVIGQGDGGAYARALAAVIAEADGIHAYHHAVVDRLARDGGVAAIEAAAAPWQEIDRPEDIEAWRRGRSRPPR